MPKRGGGRFKDGRADSDHYEHDNRTNNHSSTRRVWFKSGANNKGHKGNKYNLLNAAKLMDDDIDMGASGNTHRPYRGSFRGRGGRLNSPGPKTIGYKRKFIPGVLPWYQITIPYGAKHEKDVVLRALLGYLSPDIFIPHYYKTNGNAAIFYVDDVKTAEKIFNADRKITMPDGFKLMTIVKNNVPHVIIDDTMKDLMKQVMAKRYNAANKALDLTKFHADPDLRDIFCALFRPMIMLAAIEIIAENIPDLEALNLNDNKLHGLEHLKILSSKLKFLKILYLGDNRIPVIASLEPLRGLPLTELYLQGNPLVSRCRDHEIYISAKCVSGSEYIKRVASYIATLNHHSDGVELPPAIGFDVSEEVSLPPIRQSFLVDPQGQDFVRNFLMQYYAIYDSDSRQSLLEAYHENAVMSMAASYQTSDSRSSQTLRLNAYISNSRNILRLNDREVRKRHLKIGKLQVVSFLSGLPKTKHDLMGFSVDLIVYTPQMIVLTINGVFKETLVSEQPTRSFHRTFVVVSVGAGYLITNDTLFITNTTKEQEDKCFTSELVTVAPAPAPAPAPLPSLAAPEATDAVKMQLVAAVSQHTGMNQLWSTNCLNETGWDLQKALHIFNNLQSEGKIPHDAFVK